MKNKNDANKYVTIINIEYFLLFLHYSCYYIVRVEDDYESNCKDASSQHKDANFHAYDENL